MKKTHKVMGMTAVVEIADQYSKDEDIDKLFDYFDLIDLKFSTYKKDSEVEKINRGEVLKKNYSQELKKILTFADRTKKETMGYFNVYNNGKLDPSGIVKGYAIYTASKMLRKMGYKNYYVEIGGDIDIRGKNKNSLWSIGIKHPFKENSIVKVLHLQNCGIATSGSYTKGVHIYDKSGKITHEIASITVIGPNVYEADRMATAAYAMGKMGIDFIEKMKNLEGYMIGLDGTATYTSNFEKYVN